MKPKIFLIGAVIAALLQVYFAAGFIFDRAKLLQHGQEVLLNTGFIDPRDLFRGHYVRLRLSIEGVERSELASFDKIGAHKDVYAELIVGEDGFWEPTRLTAQYPESPKGPVIKGTLGWRGTDEYSRTININFPIDRYFAPKLEAKKLEKLRRDRKLGIIVALDDRGQQG